MSEIKIDALSALKACTAAQLELSEIARNIVERVDRRSGFTWAPGVLIDLRASVTAAERCLLGVREYLIREYDSCNDRKQDE